MRRNLLVGWIIYIRERYIPEIALAHAEGTKLRSAGKTRQVERVAFEFDNGGIRAAALHALHAAVDQHEECSAAGFDDLAIFGERGRPLVRIASVIDKNPEQLPVAAALTDMQSQAPLDVDETPRLDNVD